MWDLLLSLPAGGMRWAKTPWSLSLKCTEWLEGIPIPHNNRSSGYPGWGKVLGTALFHAWNHQHKRQAWNPDEWTRLWDIAARWFMAAIAWQRKDLWGWEVPNRRKCEPRDCDSSFWQKRQGWMKSLRGILLCRINLSKYLNIPSCEVFEAWKWTRNCWTCLLVPFGMISARACSLLGWVLCFNQSCTRCCPSLEMNYAIPAND